MKPELGEIKVGDKVIVPYERYKYVDGRRKTWEEPNEHTVVKVARVWITTQSAEPFQTEWRFRRDVQHTGEKDYPQHRHYFYTPEQWEYREKTKEARDYLMGVGLSQWNLGKAATRWVSDDHVVEFAAHIREFEERMKEQS